MDMPDANARERNLVHLQSETATISGMFVPTFLREWKLTVITVCTTLLLILTEGMSEIRVGELTLYWISYT